MTANETPVEGTAKNTAAADKAKIKAKVAKLLAQAEDSGVTDEERQTFAAKAADMLARYGLDAATVRAEKGQKPEGLGYFQFEISGQGWHGKARASLIYSVVAAYGAEATTIGNRMNGETRWVGMVGTASMIEALKLLLPSILLQAETAVVPATKAHMVRVGPDIATAANKNIERRNFLRSYLKGYGHGVADKIKASRDTMAEDVKGKPGELVLVTDAERIAAAFVARFPKLGTVSADKVSLAGLTAGRRDGRTADTGQAKVQKKADKQVGG